MKKRFEFDPEQAYQLVKVTNTDGSEKTKRLDFYEKYLGCKTTGICYEKYLSEDGRHRLWMYFVQDEDGKWIRRNIHTTDVCCVEEVEGGVKIHTENSIYHLQKTELKKPEIKNESDLIELYLSLDDNDYFCKGYYYDNEQKVYELYTHLHTGMIVDSVLVGISDQIVWGAYICRYFIRPGKVEFYDTLYHQQDYSVPILIHNNGSSDMIVCFEFHEHTWTIKPGESKRIIPFSSEGADKLTKKEENVDGL